MLTHHSPNEEIKFDKTCLEQVLYRILSNASKIELEISAKAVEIGSQ